MADEDLYGTDFQDEDFGDEPYDMEGEDLAAEPAAEAAGDQNADQPTAEIDELKNKLRALEEEANKLKGAQSPAAGADAAGTSAAAGAANTAADQAAREEVDARSIYVGNVDYGCTPEELQMHFSSCGTVNRVTILTDKGGNPKGFAYVEFLEVDAVQSAVMLNDSELRGRQIKVTQKRTNVPGLKARGRGRGRGRGGRGGMPYGMPMPFYPPFGYPGYFPVRGRGRGRGRGHGYAPY